MSRLHSQSAQPDAVDQLALAKGYLVDWDGCCAIDNRLLPSAVQFLRANQSKTVIISNNSTNTPEDFLRLLRQAGIEMRADQIILAGVEALSRAAEIGSARTLLLSNPRMKFLARRLGVSTASDNPDLIVLLRDTGFSYSRLEQAVNALSKGARLIVSNPDKVHPGRSGAIRPETGALMAAIRACVDLPESRVEIIGKPSQRLYLKGCNVLDQSPSSVVMIGDNRATDIAGAEALGMAGVLVSPGPEAFFSNLVSALRIA